jgi:hypothetical protein
MLDNQSNTDSFSHAPVAQLPLLLHPLGTPSLPVAQLLHPMCVIFLEKPKAFFVYKIDFQTNTIHQSNPH